MSFQQIEEYIASLPERFDFPLGDCAVWHKGQCVARKTYGAAQGGELYWLFSCTKPITASATLRLVQDGVLGLDDPVSKYLPEAAHLTVQEGDTVRPARTVLTVRHLLTMTGGFDYNLERVRPLIDENPTASTREIIGYLLGTPLCFDPGEHFQYSLCHDVLAAVIEVATGKSFGQVLRKLVFEPLGMNDTGFAPTPEQAARIVPDYMYDNDNRKSNPVSVGNGFTLGNRGYESGGAGLFSTVEDYGKFARTLAAGGTSPDNGYELLRRDTLDILRADQLNDALKVDFKNVWRPGYSYGCGVRTMVDPESIGSRSPVGEFGWDGAAGCYVCIVPEYELAIFYAQQIHCCGPAYSDVHITLREMACDALK